jgi:hypothetical protein
MDMNDNHKRAKLDVLKALRQVAMDLISEKAEEGQEGEMPGHMQKVSVMAKDPEGLEKGLDKAKDLLESGMPEVAESEMESLESDDEEDLAESAGLEGESDDEESMLMKKLEELRNKKNMLK